MREREKMLVTNNLSFSDNVSLQWQKITYTSKLQLLHSLPLNHRRLPKHLRDKERILVTNIFSQCLSLYQRQVVHFHQLFLSASQNFIISPPPNHDFRRPCRKASLKTFENIVGKGENAGNQHFLLFLQCFPPFLKEILIFSVIFILLSANTFNLDQSKICCFIKSYFVQGWNIILTIMLYV